MTDSCEQNPGIMKFDCEVKPVKYLDGYPKLPVDAPVGYPHIIGIECLDEDFYASQPIGIADLVVTVLFKFMPGALTAFLDLNRPKFPLHPSRRPDSPGFLHQERRSHGIGEMIPPFALTMRP